MLWHSRAKPGSRFVQDRAWPGSVGRGRAGQRQTGCNRATPDRSGKVGKGRTGHGRATKGLLVPGTADQDLTGPGMVSRTGQLREGQCQGQAGAGRASQSLGISVAGGATIDVKVIVVAPPSPSTLRLPVRSRNKTHFRVTLSSTPRTTASPPAR